MQRALKRVLLVRTDRLGDVILTLPMLPRLRRAIPDGFLSMLLRKYTGEIVGGNPFADELLWYDDGSSPVPFLAMLSLLRRRRFDVVILARPTLRLALLMWMARIPIRIGTGYRYYSLLFTRRVYEHRKDARRHELEYNLNLLRGFEFKIDPPVESVEFGIRIPVEADHSVRELLATSGIREDDRLIVIHPASGGSARDWPPERLGALANTLIDAGRGTVVVTGVHGEEPVSEEVVRATGGRAVSLIGKLSVKELGALIRMARLYVSNSTGPLHLAVAMGTPVLGFYPQLPSMSAKRWGPYTSKSRVLVPERPLDCHDCSGRRGERCDCMASITVEQAFRAACELLDEATHEHRKVAGHAR